jgi:hypothetical protein
MRGRDLRGRILLAVGLGGAAAACGTSGTTEGADAGMAASVDGGDASSGFDAAGAQDAASPADGAAAADAPVPGDASTDALPTVRRPFLVGTSLRAAPPVARGDWGRSDLPPANVSDARTSDALAAAWLKDALEEHASVAAFARFALHLLAIGAPAELVAAAQGASIDEIAHARGCFALARRYGAGNVGPGPLSLDDALRALPLEQLVDLAVEEGCVGETLGALLAEAQRANARDPHAAALLERVAADEARHAELAWRFLRWALDAGGEPTERAAVAAFRRAVARTRAMIVRPPAYDVATWRAHGRTTCEEARTIAEAGIRDVLEPCFAALLEARARGALGVDGTVVGA